KCEIAKDQLLSLCLVRRPNGPCEEGKLYWRGHPYPLPAKQWRLVKALWGHGPVAVEKVAEEVYGDGLDVKDRALRKLMFDCNITFLKWKLPLEAVRPMVGYLELAETPTGRPNVTPGVTRK